MMASECFSISADEVGEGWDAAAFGRGAPAFEVGAGVGRLGAAVEVAELFFEFPGAPEPVAVSPHQAQDLPVVVVEVLAAGPDSEAGASPVSR
jgi:hypothetical protein